MMNMFRRLKRAFGLQGCDGAKVPAPRADEVADDLFRYRAGDVASTLTDLQRRALAHLHEFYGRGPRRLAAILEISITDARGILRFFRKEGICAYGPLWDEDSGLLLGSGYWLDRFGQEVRRIALGEDE